MNPSCNALLEPMVRIIECWTRGRQDCPTPVAGLDFFRRESQPQPAHCLIRPSIVVVVQGAKRAVAGAQSYDYDASRFLVTSLEMPARSLVVTASSGLPCLGLTLNLDLRMIAELMVGHEDAPVVPRRRQAGRRTPAQGGIDVGTMTLAILEPLKRLVELLEEPSAIPVLAPLYQREIHYRLLMSEQSERLRQFTSVESQSYRIGKAIHWLSLHYSQSLCIDDLAASVNMSAPSFHQHFRQLTTMSPLQYQKWLRLNEARRLMLNEGMDAGSAAFAVGYESPSQFSREYSRLFGAPPKRDIAELQAAALAHPA